MATPSLLNDSLIVIELESKADFNRRERISMEIERINENTIKFYISYLDIEDRGFEREEIWYDRERSEQLFWQMIEEVNRKEDDFVFEGPLWIQIQALEKGIEVIVTKSQILKDENLDLPLSNQEKIESIFGKNFQNTNVNDLSDKEVDQDLSMVVYFNDLEDLIQFSHYYQEDVKGLKNRLYHYNDKYYLYLKFCQETHDDETLENYMSQILEFADDSDVSIHMLEEYGKKIFQENAIAQIRSYFTA